ncbi:MAG TPA: class I SAM-dependent methyltransferase [Gemmatimonadaceae bacterium]|nr:class I SAM-dependent methyltransferase [Gemmatimonadaceae bacterium]
MSDGAGRHFAHLFSGHATTYAAYRPTYPPALFAWLEQQAPGCQQAWDVGTGNGQVAIALAEAFGAVLATDPSETQLAAAATHPRVTYRQATYDSGLPDRSVELVTVGQALHWFDLDAFFAELRRVLVPGGFFAAFAYVHSQVTPAVDAVTLHYHDVTCAEHWAPEHHLIRAGYRSMPLPIVGREVPPFEIRSAMSLEQYLGFHRSWSATQRLLAAGGEGAVQAFERAVMDAWGDVPTREVAWPMFVRAGRLA